MTLPTSEILLKTTTILQDRVTLEVRVPGERARRIAMLHDEFLIGRAGICDLRLDDDELPLVHSELHRQGGVLWIEASDEGTWIEINGRTYSRLALRNGDRLQIGAREVVVRIGEDVDLPEERDTLDEDLSELSADELCERILAEQSEIDEFERRRLAGWKGLVTALEATLAETQPAEGQAAAERMTAVLTELRQISEHLGEQARQLADQEAEVLEVTAQLRSTQDVMSRKLDQLLQRFGEGDLRASA